MHLLLTIIVFLIILSVLVIAHEFGHYYFAKRAGVQVDEFGFGIPPRLWSRKIGETLYSVNSLPFGGFVRLFGEDSSDPTTRNNPKSYNNKPLRQRFLIVTAGVLMNLLIAVLLLSFGFFFGIKPLLIDQNDVLEAIRTQQLEIKSGYVVKNVADGSSAKNIGIEPGDLFVEINGKNILTQATLTQAVLDGQKTGLSLKIRRGGALVRMTVPKEKLDEKGLGVELYDSFLLPRVSIQHIDPTSEMYKGGIRDGDMLLTIDSVPVYSADDYQSLLTKKTALIQYQREFNVYETNVTFPQRRSVVVNEVLAGSTAEKAGLHKDDLVLQIQRQDVGSADEAIQLLNAAKSTSQPVQLLVQRGTKMEIIYVSAGSNGSFGIQVAPIINQNLGVTLQATATPTSVVDLHSVKYGFFKSIGMSFYETYRLGKATIVMFGSLVGDIFSSFSVPEGVSGPVGIAQMTGVFIQEGFMSLLRFMALLSLSLAVLNLLPFPGLDGGRLLFIIIEGIIGRPVNQKFEQAVHIAGGICLILILLAVTYKDISRLF